jgi:hypothetical protein
MTGPQRGARHQRSRTSRAWVFGATGLAVAIVAAVTAVIVVTRHGGSAAPHPAPLATNITTSQPVGLANLGPPTTAASAAGNGSLLATAGGALAFTPGSGGQTVRPSQQWQADQMGGGSYILVFTPDGRCLSTTSKRGATAVLARCNLGLSDRWYHSYLGTDATGRGYWQLRSAANGRCLAVGVSQPGGGATVALQPCAPSMPWQQLITFFTAF